MTSESLKALLRVLGGQNRKKIGKLLRNLQNPLRGSGDKPAS
ncbi:hypothetical protein FHX08_006386 [Rhizobium sp. BK529]|nr:hypothetical protein [Rhizobium sp. BK529]